MHINVSHQKDPILFLRVIMRVNMAHSQRDQCAMITEKEQLPQEYNLNTSAPCDFLNHVALKNVDQWFLKFVSASESLRSL